ncbi:MAG TPA: acyl-CoA dehydrogenase family protein [Mycobacteriales bacterium]|nr:acyl-CoA dehydrogenase family protein [Mycobacteriales bacterium]
MDLDLSPEQRAVRATFAQLFQRSATAERVRAAEPAGWDADLWREYVDVGALEIGVDEQAGGAGGGLVELALIAEEAGRTLAPIPCAAAGVATRLLAAADASEALTQVLSGERLVSFAPSTAPLPGQLLVDGAITDAVIALQDDRLALVERPDRREVRANVGASPLQCWSGTAAHTVLATGGKARDLHAHAVDELRVLRAASLVGLAHRAIELGAAYAKVRTAFGDPIGRYQAVAHPLADALVACDGAQLLCWKAAWALDAGLDRGSALAGMAFVHAAETAQSAAGHSLHVHGGYGFMEETDIQLYYRRAKAWTVALADPARELLRVADELLAG